MLLADVPGKKAVLRESNFISILEGIKGGMLKSINNHEFLTETTLPEFLKQLTNITITFSNQVAGSPNNIKAIVKILTNVANISSSLDISISSVSMKNVLITAGILSSNKTKDSWNRLNIDDAKNISHNNSEPESSSGDINNISLTFDIFISTLGNPECVFWNFSLFDGLGGWDNEGCEVVLNINETGTVTCSCNHLTSFSILMSPNSPKKLYLDIITYIGVGLSMGSLVICLIIEALIWRKIRRNETSYLRHVSIVNIAVSLLIANIWFIIGAAISDADVKNPPACTAATFFIHFFYLALFFWMLASALLLLYRMLAIGFILGYGAPLIIATITIAATAPANGYIRENTICWLNWEKSKALLAFVIPALLIVVINLIILVVMVYKIVRRRVGANAAQADERHVLKVIAKSAVRNGSLVTNLPKHQKWVKEHHCWKLIKCICTFEELETRKRYTNS
ncbi:adhesion G protein-coupled receptor F5-like [Archocentrus centrarchus]|uniref:adhesion G protein-coupled receptor F5-like n=1 Tax=Archocentrus centrarchus TaxID=63155 RepID=UPI0011EA3D9F|nr:adhesion G protein-coupled receptor F5-like [Archocentrus centrarchus]